MRCIGEALARPQGLQRWKLLVAWFSVATAVGPRPAVPEKELLVNQDARAKS